MQTFPEDWDLITKIDHLQRKIILNSILYYEYNMSNISDFYYDNMCKQLVEYQHIYSRHGDIITDNEYGYVYFDFDGSTGYHLFDRLNAYDKKYLLSITDWFVRNRERK